MARQRGLTWQRTADVIRTFVSQYGMSTPRRALMCTYDLDLPRFEAVLLPEMTRRGRQFRTLVMADAGALQAHLRSSEAHRFARYQVSPVRCTGGGVFHPKVVLLAAGQHYLVGIGSANLTAGGLGGNLELMLFADAGTEHGRRLVGGAAAFFDALMDSDAPTVSNSAREFIRLTLAGIRREPTVLAHSLDRALLPQMASRARAAGIGTTREVAVLSPWHSVVESTAGTDPSVLRQIQRAFGGGVALYTEGRGGRGPNVGRSAKVHIRVEHRVVDDDADDAAFDRRPIRVHAKAYLVRAAGGSVLFFGSANCTRAALTRSAPRGGNVEVIVASRLSEQQDTSFRADLAELFAPATKWFPPESTWQRGGTRGSILCGQLLQNRDGPFLELEVPGTSSGRVVIASSRHGSLVSVRVRKGTGTVRDPADLRCLFPDKIPERNTSSWGAVLLERSGRDWIPFPVSVPLIGAGGTHPDDALAELLFEEAGFWPAEESSESVGDAETALEEPHAEEVDEDLETLTEARHQGELDRLAVVLAVLRRRICSRGAAPD